MPTPQGKQRWTHEEGLVQYLIEQLGKLETAVRFKNPDAAAAVLETIASDGYPEIRSELVCLLVGVRVSREFLVAILGLDKEPPVVEVDALDDAELV